MTERKKQPISQQEQGTDAAEQSATGEWLLHGLKRLKADIDQWVAQHGRVPSSWEEAFPHYGLTTPQAEQFVKEYLATLAVRDADAKRVEKANRAIKSALRPVEVDYRRKGVPAWVRDLVETHFAIEAEDAKSAGSLGFMARALVIATMPYKDPKVDAFTRQNGDFRLRIVAGYEGGIPFGIYPRLLMSWVTSEAVRTQSPVIALGDSLRLFLREVLDLRSSSGGSRGTATRVSEQIKRTFGSLITAQYSGTQDYRPFLLKNVLIASELELDEEELLSLDDDGETPLWTPQEREEAGRWHSKVQLSENFFQECITNPVPIDLRAYKGLRGAGPLAMDLYTWLTYRLSYTQKKTAPIPWEMLMMQFGSSHGITATTEQSRRQAVLDFKRAFLKALKAVQVVYPDANVKVASTGLVLLPSKPHVAPGRNQLDLF